MADRRYTINACTINLRLPADSRVGLKDKIATASFTGTSLGRATSDSTSALLALLSREDVKGTFFVEGQMVEKGGTLLQEIAAQGHEIGLLISHPPSSPLSSLRETVAKEKHSLESFLGRSVPGCRMLPFLSGGHRSQAAYEVLAEEGCIYSSSIYPPRDFRIGIQNSRRRAWGVRIANKILWELPLTSWRPFGLGIASVQAAHPERYPTWTIARNIEGMNRHGEPALISLDCIPDPTMTELHIAGKTAERLHHIFKAYRFGTTFDAFASRLTLGFDDSIRQMHRRTGIVRCDARTAAPLL